MKKRSECNCTCHTNPRMMHMVACCEPDTPGINPEKFSVILSESWCSPKSMVDFLIPEKCSQVVHLLLDETEHYYKKSIKQIEPYIVDFIEIMKSESASTYYSATQKKVIKREELEELLDFIVNLRYGA